MNDTPIPAAYRDGFAKAAALDPDLAARYVAHTAIGDPLADDAVESLAAADQRTAHRLIQAGMDRDESAFAAAPEPLREFFAQLEAPPAWFDASATYAGCRAFHAYSDLFIPAFFVVTLQNAATLISKAFYTTGRVTTGQGPRRIQQNTRHFIEIMLPGALDRDGEGWKLSARIRLVHAQVRRLVRASGKWDEDTYGVPISAAHMGLASANFSATMLAQASRLGARLDADARASFMQIWRCASLIIGTPEALLFEGDEAKTAHLHKIATICEPPPGHESSVIANTLVESVPLIAGIESERKRRNMALHVYRVSRALLGDDLADALEFPKQRTRGLLRWLRLRRSIDDFSHRALHRRAKKWRGNNFVFLLDASSIDDLSYRLPDHLEAEKQAPW